MKLSKKLSAFLFDTSARKIWLGVGLILTMLGQSLIREPLPFAAFNNIAELLNHWNKIFYLSLNNPVNVLIGLLLILFAAIIYSRLFRSTNEAMDIQPSFINSKNWAGWNKSLPWLIASLSAYLLVLIQLASHRYSNLLLGVWLFSLLGFTFIFWKNENQETMISSRSVSNLDGAYILALFAFAIAAGAYLLNDLPAGWIPDEGPFWKMARSIALGEKSPPFFDFGVFTFPVASSILQGWIMRWAGVTMWGWRFSSVLPAALTVIPLYLLAYELFDRRVAIAANVLMIMNPYFLTFARLGYNNSQSLFPVTLCIYWLVIGLRKNSRFYLWLAGLAAGLGFYTYFSAWLGLVVLALVVLSLPLVQDLKFQKSIISLAIILAGAFVVFLPRILYGASGDTPVQLHFKIWETGPINTFYGRHIFGIDRIAQSTIFMMSDQVELFYDPTLYGILFIRGVVRSAAVLFDPIGYIDHPIIFGLAGIGSSIFFIPGLGMALANFKKMRYRIPSLWFLAGFFFLGALSSFAPRPTHMVAIIPVLAFISAIGLVSFLDALLSKSSYVVEQISNWKKIATAIILLLISVTSLFQAFILTPYAYLPPSADDYISWLGRQTSTPTKIFLVNHYSTERNPNDESLLKLSPHKVSFFTRAELESDPTQMETWNHFIAFVDPKEGGQYAEWMAQNIPNAHLQPAYAPGKRLRGYIVTDMQVNSTMNISIAYGLQTLWNSPARIIFILCGIGIISFLWRNKYRIK